MTKMFFHPLLALIASATDKEPARYVEFLKEENKILRARIPGTPARTQTLLHHDQQELGQLLWDVAFSPDGEHLAIAGQKGVWLWRGADRVAELTNKTATILLFLPDGRRIVWREQAKARVSLWNLETSREEPPPKPLTVGGLMAMFGDHQLLHVAGQNKSDWSPTLQLTDLRTGDSMTWNWSNVPRFLSEMGWGTGFVLAQDRSSLVLNGMNLTAWDLNARRLQWVLPGEANPSHSFDWSPDRSQLAIGLTDGTVAIWNLPAVRQQLESIGRAWE
jgi:WD40 repeat protein